MKVFEKANDIRCAVIGYGGAYNMGKAHLSQMEAAGMQPVAVAEIDASRLEVALGDFPGIQTFATVGEMLTTARPDLVAIITPHNTHAELALQCLRAGAGVVCEKPMSITLEESDEMIATAKESDLLLSVYHNRHWDGCILEARDRILEKKEIGKVFRVEAHMGGFGNPGDWWRASRSISGGIHYDWGVHLLEYTLQLVDSEAIEVSAFATDGTWETRWGKDTNEDELTAIVRFANGTFLNLRLTTLDANPDPAQVVFTGTEGKYYMDQRGYEIHQVCEGENVRRRGTNHPGEQEKYYLNVADAMTGKGSLVITPEWSRRTMEILAMATESVRSGRALALR